MSSAVPNLSVLFHSPDPPSSEMAGLGVSRIQCLHNGERRLVVWRSSLGDRHSWGKPVSWDTLG